MDGKENVLDFSRCRRTRGAACLKIKDLLAKRAHSLPTIRPAETVGNLSGQLQRARVGVMMVSEDGKRLDGIVSERDIAYGLSHHRAALYSLPVSAIMTRSVVSCSPGHTLPQAARLMDAHNVRHLPVVDATESVVGIVSRWDLIEMRLDEIEAKSDLLKDWLADHD